MTKKLSTIKGIMIQLVIGMCVIHAAHAQVINDDCPTATSLPVFVGETFSCIEGTTKQALPDDNDNSPCQAASFPKVWYKLTEYYNATHFSLQAKSADDKVVMMQLFGTNSGCEALKPIPLTLNEQYCVLSLNGKINIVAKEIQYKTYYIAITVMDVNGGDFSICTNFSKEDPECGARKSMIVYPEDVMEVPQRPFTTGQTLNISMKVDAFSAVKNGCQWLQGLVPVLGSGWEPSSFTSEGEPYGTSLNGNDIYEPQNGLYGNSTWSWFTDVDYHVVHKYYQVGDFDDNGTLDMCHTIYQKDCPDLGGLLPGCCTPCWGSVLGSQLPGGWFAYGINGTCSSQGPPVRYDWGDGNSCSDMMGPWNFEYQLTIKSVSEFQCNPAERVDEVTLGFYTFTDGEIGSWRDGAGGCAFDAPIVETLPVVCLHNVCSDTIIPVYACDGDKVIIEPQQYFSNISGVSFWGFYTNRDDEGVSEGYLSVSESFRLAVSNHHVNALVHIPVYLYGYSSGQTVTCILKLDVIVFPLPLAGFTFTKSGMEVSFHAIQQIDSSYQWTFGDSTSSNESDPVHTYLMNGIYNVQLIVSNSECGADTTYKTIRIGFEPDASFATSTEILCSGDTLLLNATSTHPQVAYQWIIEGGIPNATDQSFIQVIYPDTGYFDIGLIVQNELGADTVQLDSAVHVILQPEIKYGVEVYDSLEVFNFLGDPSLEVQWWFEDSLVSVEHSWSTIFDTNGKYFITIKAFNECGADSITFKVDVSTVGTHEAESDPVLHLYPNPASNELFVFLNPLLNIKQITLYNSLGKAIPDLNIQPYGDGYRLSALDHLPHGLYLLEVESVGKRWYSKFVLQ